MIELESERLLLRTWRNENFAGVAAIFTDEQTARYIGGVVTRDEAWRRFATLVGHWVLRGFGIWALEEKSTVGGLSVLRAYGIPQAGRILKGMAGPGLGSRSRAPGADVSLRHFGLKHPGQHYSSRERGIRASRAAARCGIRTQN